MPLVAVGIHLVTIGLIFLLLGAFAVDRGSTDRAKAKLAQDSQITHFVASGGFIVSGLGFTIVGSLPALNTYSGPERYEQLFTAIAYYVGLSWAVFCLPMLAVGCLLCFRPALVLQYLAEASYKTPASGAIPLRWRIGLGVPLIVLVTWRLLELLTSC